MLPSTHRTTLRRSERIAKLAANATRSTRELSDHITCDKQNNAQGDASAESSKQDSRKRNAEILESIHQKRARTSAIPRQQTYRAVAYWTQTHGWDSQADMYRTRESSPTSATRRRFEERYNDALPHRRSPSLRRRTSASSIGTDLTRTPSDQQCRDRKSAAYTHVLYEQQLGERGSFMRKHSNGVAGKSEELCKTLLDSPQRSPTGTIFCDETFERACEMVRTRNETRVIRDVGQLLTPSAELRALWGADHLEPVRELLNAGWNNAITFCGPRPQPDYSLGFKREAFTRAQLQKLSPYLGDELEDRSYFAATHDTFFPFFTCEAKCGASALDVADRQNAHSQTVALQGLLKLFRLAGRESDLHRQIKGFSISHSDESVRIWGHYVFIDESNVTFHRHSISKFEFTPTAEGDHRWKAYQFVANLYDEWVPKHFSEISSVIDAIPAYAGFDASHEYRPLYSESGRSALSGLSQEIRTDGVDDLDTSDAEQSTRRTTPETDADIAQHRKQLKHQHRL